MARLKLSAPWEIYAKEAAELFRHDRDVHVVFDGDAYALTLYVDDGKKAAALETLMPAEKTFGNVKVRVSVVPANCAKCVTERDLAETFVRAFDGNGAFSFVRTVRGIFPEDLVYVVFKNRVVQYFNDDLGDVYGQKSTLYQDIAKNVLADLPNVFYCTDVPGGTGAAPGQWP